MSLERRVETLEEMTPVANRVSVIRRVVFKGRMRMTDSRVRRARANGLTFECGECETEQSFLDRVKSHMPANWQGVIVTIDS